MTIKEFQEWLKTLSDTLEVNFLVEDILNSGCSSETSYKIPYLKDLNDNINISDFHYYKDSILFLGAKNVC